MYKHLRRSHRKRKKRYGSPEQRGQIPDRVSIDKRPKIVDAKKCIGDREADTIIGRNHKGARLTRRRLVLLQPFQKWLRVANYNL